MFDEGFRSEYKSIKAPEELYARIINAEPVRKRNNVVAFRRIAASAAAFAQ